MARLFIGGLPEDASRTELEHEFETYGALRDVWVARNPPGFGFILFEDSRDASDALKAMDGRRICGSRIRVEFARGGTGGKGTGAQGQKCHACSKFGHDARDCRSNPPSRFGGGGDRGRDNNRGYGGGGGGGDRFGDRRGGGANYGGGQRRSRSRSNDRGRRRRSPTRSRSKERVRNDSPPQRRRSLSRSVSPKPRNNRSPSPRNRRSRSNSRAKSRSKSRSRSPQQNGKNGNRSDSN